MRLCAVLSLILEWKQLTADGNKGEICIASGLDSPLFEDLCSVVNDKPSCCSGKTIVCEIA